MKKTLLILLVVLACMAITVPVFAVSITSETSVGSVTFAPSTHVHLTVVSNNGTDSPPNQYYANSWHEGSVNQSAGYEYGAASTDSTLKRASLSGTITVTECSGAISLTSNLTTMCAPPSGAAWGQ